MTDSLQEIAKNYSSQILSRQILQDAPADIFFSADEAQMDVVAKAGLVIEKTRSSLLSNTLVIIAPKDFSGHQLSLKELAQPAF